MVQAFLLCAGLAAAQVPEAAPAVRSDPRAIEKLVASLSDPAARRDAQAALLSQLTSDELRDLDSWSGLLAPEAETSIARALEEISESSSFGPATRARAVRAWGALGKRFRSSRAIEQTVSALVADAAARDSREPLRAEALLALAKIAELIPSIELRAQRELLSCAFDALRETRDPRERAQAMRILFGYVGGHGTGALEQSPDLMRRLRTELIDPLRAGIDWLYADRTVYGPEYRAWLYGCLFRLTHARTSDERLRFDCVEVLKRADDSRLETDPQLRQLLHYYATGLLR